MCQLPLLAAKFRRQNVVHLLVCSEHRFLELVGHPHYLNPRLLSRVRIAALKEMKLNLRYNMEGEYKIPKAYPRRKRNQVKQLDAPGVSSRLFRCMVLFILFNSMYVTHSG